MANNLRKFATEAEYTAATLNYPAVSWITATDGVHFDKTAPTPTFGGLTVYYYIDNPNVEITLFNGGGSSSESESEGGGSLPTTMIVDGVSETPINTWRFETAGEHIVQYTFDDNAIFENFAYSIDNITKVEIGDDIVTTGLLAFSNCTSLSSCTIGSGVTEISEATFQFSTSLTSVTIKAIEPPSVTSNSFGDTNNCPIYVPSSAVDTYTSSTSTGWSEYASRIQAIQ